MRPQTHKAHTFVFLCPRPHVSGRLISTDTCKSSYKIQVACIRIHVNHRKSFFLLFCHVSCPSTFLPIGTLCSVPLKVFSFWLSSPPCLKSLPYTLGSREWKSLNYLGPFTFLLVGHWASLVAIELATTIGRRHRSLAVSGGHCVHSCVSSVVALAELPVCKIPLTDSPRNLFVIVYITRSPGRNLRSMGEGTARSPRTQNISTSTRGWCWEPRFIQNVPRYNRLNEDKAKFY